MRLKGKPGGKPGSGEGIGVGVVSGGGTAGDVVGGASVSGLEGVGEGALGLLEIEGGFGGGTGD